MIKERIIKESFSLFVRYGVKTTMDDIAKHMGISKRTIYENFKDKSTLLTECTDYMTEEARLHASDIFNHTENVLEAILQLLYRQNVKGKQNMKFMIELGKYYPDIYKNHLLKYHEQKQKGVIDLMRKGIEEGVFRENLNPMLTSFMFSEQANLIFSEQFQKFNADMESSFGTLSEMAIFEDMVISYIRGICTVKGIEIFESFLKQLKQSNRL